MSNQSAAEDEMNDRLHQTPIAIIGIASIFPQAKTLPEYWDNILGKIDSIVDVPASRWNIDDYYDPNPSAPDKVYCKRGGFIPDIDFDPMEFGLPPNILEVTDVSQLISLVVAKDAMEDAGYGEERQFSREKTGVVLGVVGMSSKLFSPLMTRLQYPVWEKVLLSSGVSAEDAQRIIDKIKLAYVGWEENSFPGSIANVIAGRIANRLDLGGTNCVVDAACGSSLAAIKIAVDELVTGRADMMISGGVDTDNSIVTYMCFSKTPAFSKSDHVRTFDSESDGMMVGEGLGMLVLKRLPDAERDGDRIYAVIRGVGTSSDGRFKSIYAPRASGQALAIRRAYEQAGYEPSTIGLVEAHGTGTMAGDPAEFQGLMEAFGKEVPAGQRIGLGSVKSQIGHTKAAAGSASLIKVAMALHHKVLPPTINVTRPNPKFDLENSPFYLNTETRPWFRADPETPRRAGVSSFGFGGTNFHVTVEEYTPEHKAAYRLNSVPQQILLAADTPAMLLTACQDALAKLQSENGDEEFTRLAANSRQSQIPAAFARLGFVAETSAEAKDSLQQAIATLKDKTNEDSWEHPKGIYYRKTGIDPQGKIVALFSGQGSQYVNMGRELAMNFPPLRETIGAFDHLFLADGRQPLSGKIYPPPVFDDAQREQQVTALQRTENAQPAIGAVGVGLFKIMQAAGFKPDHVAGHSFGELTALWASGVLSDEDYFFLAKSRGQAMAAPDDPNFDAGTMLAVKGDVEKVAEEVKEIPGVVLANWNAKNQVALAGPKAAIAQAQSVLSAKGFSCVPLPVSAAFHTPLVGHAQKPFAEAIKKADFRTPSTPVYSNTTGKRHPDDPKAIRKSLAEHILHPVLFKDEIEEIYAAGGYVFVEFGPKNVLTNLVKNTLEGKPHLAIAMNANAKKDSDRQMRDAVVQLRVAGLELGDIDPYQAERKGAKPRKKSGISVTLNGGLYLTEKTRTKFDQSLKDGFQISAPAGSNGTKPVKVEATIPARPAVTPAPVAASAPAPRPAGPAPVQTGVPAASKALDTLENTISQFQTSQSETQKVHAQYLENDAEYGKIFSQLTQMEFNLVANRDMNPDQMEGIRQVLQSLERSMMRFHDHQEETLRVHEKYLNGQTEFSQSFIRLIKQQHELLSTSGAVAYPASPVEPSGKSVSHSQPGSGQEPGQPYFEQPAIPGFEPMGHNGNGSGHGNGNGNGYQPHQAVETVATMEAPALAPVKETAPASSVQNPAALKASLLDVVSEKTGYPQEMLDLGMDMEADLGIDSIKRVEILGAMQERFPSLPKVDNSALSEMRTLGQIIEYMSAGVDTPSSVQQPAANVVADAAVTPAPTASPVTPATTGKPDAAALTAALLEVVSEKTGYPSEMLDLNMDMEADLGIDSIKRVEILGAMQERFPELPKVDGSALSEMRTLGQIVEFMSQGLDSHGAPTPVTGMASDVGVALVAEPVQVAIAASDMPDMNSVRGALLEVVSEKTGYPQEMLELGMDMEADLGIDSIKRVEILGAMQDRFPGLPKVQSDQLAELRTLGQIIDYLGTPDHGADGTSVGTPVAAPVEVAQVAETPAVVAQVPAIPRGVVRTKLLPPPDAVDFTLPAGRICLLTDDGTPLTGQMAQSFLEKGWKTAVLSFPSTLVEAPSKLPEGVQRVTLLDAGDASVSQALDEVQKASGQVGIFVHLDPRSLSVEQNGDGFSQKESQVVKAVFLMAKHLKENLTAAAGEGQAAFLSVMHLDGAFGLGENGTFDPVSGGLFGLVKTLDQEWERVYCRAIDLDPAIPADQAAQYVLAELNDPNRLIVEVAYGPQGRSTLTIENSTSQEAVS
jgi:acyl transferase domain-containing protein